VVLQLGSIIPFITEQGVKSFVYEQHAVRQYLDFDNVDDDDDNEDDNEDGKDEKSVVDNEALSKIFRSSSNS
jgi:hypothetical protein